MPAPLKMTAEGKTILVTGAFPKIARLEAEYFEVPADPVSLAASLREQNPGINIFTFLEPIGDPVPQLSHSLSWDELSLLSVSTYDQWFNHQIKNTARNKLRRAEKAGIELRHVPFDDRLVAAISEIYNESPLRQGKKFRHYGKDHANVKRENSTFVDRSDFVGAFFEGEMIGFIKLVYGGRVASFMQIISMLRHRDKAPTNALLAKAVELCADRNIPWLHYGIWSRRGVGEFKKQNGFERYRVPRYHVPLDAAGRVALKLGLHKPPAEIIPGPVWDALVACRKSFYELRFRGRLTGAASD